MYDREHVNETMINAFLHLEGEDLEGKSVREILETWVDWVDARYKVARVPDVCYAIVDCNTGDMVSMFNGDDPNTKEKAKETCASLNEASPPENENYFRDRNVDIEEISNAYLNMDEESFIDFLQGYGKDE